MKLLLYLDADKFQTFHQKNSNPTSPTPNLPKTLSKSININQLPFLPSTKSQFKIFPFLHKLLQISFSQVLRTVRFFTFFQNPSKSILSVSYNNILR